MKAFNLSFHSRVPGDLLLLSWPVLQAEFILNNPGTGSRGTLRGRLLGVVTTSASKIALHISSKLVLITTSFGSNGMDGSLSSRQA